MTEHRDTTRVSHRFSDDGTFIELTLTLPTTLLARLVQVADQAAEAYTRGGDTYEEITFADLILTPMAELLAKAVQDV